MKDDFFGVTGAINNLEVQGGNVQGGNLLSAGPAAAVQNSQSQGLQNQGSQNQGLHTHAVVQNVQTRREEAPLEQKEKSGRLQKKDAGLVSDLYAATLEGGSNWAGWTLLAIAVILGVGIAWSMWAKVDEITQAPGKVVPTQKEQVIQSLEGGILSELLVKEGDVVDRSQPLLRIDDTRTGTVFREGQNKVEALRAMLVRLKAEASGDTPQFSESLTRARPQAVANELRTYKARLHALEQSVEFQKKSLDLAQQELTMTEPLVQKGLISTVELLRLQRQVTDLRGKIDEQNNRFRADALSEYTKVQNELDSQSEILLGRKDSLQRTLIRSPTRGIIKNIRVNTVGGVIQPAQDILEIVPLDDALLIEARVRPSDVAFLRPGQEALVKLTAYDYSIYGALKAHLDYISPDTLRDEIKRDEVYYRVQLKTEQRRLVNKLGEPMPIIPGMIAQVEVKTGTKSILDYLLKPILKSREAFQER